MSDHCDKCDYVASTPWSLPHHIKAVHEKVKRFHCDQCDYACYYGFGMKRHQKFHESNPLFEGKSSMSNHCEFCDYVASIPSTLAHHIKAVHEKVKRFYCDLCDYACYYGFDLKKHQKFHESNPLFDGKKLLWKDNKQKDNSRGSIEDKNHLDKPSSIKEKIYYTLPRPKRGKWIVILERL